MNKGYIYIYINPRMEGLVKIGKTTRDPEEKIKKLSTTGVPIPFILVYKKLVGNCYKAEEIIHTVLEAKGLRLNSNRNFFNMKPYEAIEIIEKYFTTNPKEEFNKNEYLELFYNDNSSKKSEFLTFEGETENWVDEKFISPEQEIEIVKEAKLERIRDEELKEIFDKMTCDVFFDFDKLEKDFGYNLTKLEKGKLNKRYDKHLEELNAEEKERDENIDRIFEELGITETMLKEFELQNLEAESKIELEYHPLNELERIVEDNLQ